MMIYDMTLQHQAERRMSAAEQRRADEQLGRMAARMSRTLAAGHPPGPGSCAAPAATPGDTIGG